MTKPADFSLRRVLALTALAGFTAVAAPVLAQAQSKGKPEASKKEETAQERYRQEKQFQTKITWRLVEINNKRLPANVDVTLMIDDAYRGSGFGGCNSWSATIYPVRGQKLAMGPIAYTKKQCDATTMQIERAFLSALAAGPEWDVQNSTMTLKAGGGSLRLERAL